MLDPVGAVAASLQHGVLTIRLPQFLGLDNRRLVIQAVERESRAYTRLHLDATRLISLDAAGMGALARVARLAIEQTSNPPVLIDPSHSALQLLGSIGLLAVFDVRQPATG